MTTTVSPTTLSLNLSERYLSGWGPWEVGREIISNALDASPLSTYEYPDDDTLIVESPTAPTLAQLTVIGAGTKTSDSNTIGQFGEGFKMAALACTRDGGRLTCQTPEGTLTFSLRHIPGLPERVLHATLDPATPSTSGCRITISLVDIKKATIGRFLSADHHSTPRILPRKETDELCHIYIRGVYICSLKEKSLHHYNLVDVPLNRDRSMPERYSMMSRIGSLLQQEADTAMVKAIFRSSDTLEVACLGQLYSVTDRFANLLRDVFRSIYGERAVIAIRDEKANQRARDRGFMVMAIPESISKHLPSHLIPTSADVLPANSHLSPRPITSAHSQAIADLHLLMDALDIPAQIQLMENDDLDGEARFDGGIFTVYLHEKLFAPGQSQRRLETLFHELAHAKGDPDASVQFERELHKLGGKLARLLLPHLRPFTSRVE